ncbi:MAG: endonuclease/exonuclease/phosphatase family protein [Campylobacterota bacterium]|nr:endonuclease/exonuclease/phosphatase family protein [Campylobacterota bacterium]
MFKPSLLHHSSCGDHCDPYVPETFSLLCWNVYKNNQKHPRFQHFIHREVQKREIDFMLFQEASFQDNKAFEVSHYAYDGAANLEIRDKFYGVLTASRVESYEAKAYLSEGKESLWGPHKSLLLSKYLFKDGTSLLILNVHVINFRESRGYGRELERFLGLLREHKGAMIFAGDFNTWNHTRMTKLQHIVDSLSLKRVNFEQKGKVKSFMGRALDFIFYRGVELLQEEVINDHGLSDHHPLFVRFKK